MADVTYVPKPGGWVDNTAPAGQPPSAGATPILAVDLTRVETGITTAVGQANLALTTGSAAQDAADVVAADLATETAARGAADLLAVKVAGHIGGTPDDPIITDTALLAPLPVDQGGTGSAVQSFMDLSTAQTIAGLKIFSTAPQVAGNPTGPTDLVNKAYTDAAAQGLINKGASRLATAAALPSCTYSAGVLTATANGALSIDSTAAAVTNQVIVKNEATQANNGLYVVTDAGSGGTPWILTRAAGMDTGAEVPNAYSFVTAGATNANTGWNVAGGSYTLGTTPIVWAQFSAATAYTQGSGITIAGQVVSVTPSTFDAFGAATTAQGAAITAAATDASSKAALARAQAVGAALAFNLAGF